jgi:hypothetical protein
VQLERKPAGFGRAAKSALAGLLAIFVLVATASSVSHGLHQALHPNAPSSTHLCLICSLAKGQVTAADVAPALAIFSLILFFSVPALTTVALPASDRRLASSRAPPRSSFPV